VKTLDDLARWFREAPQRQVDAFRAAENLYREYVTARDWAEFDVARRVPAEFSSPDKYGPMLMMRYRELPWPAAVAEYDRMAQALGPSAVEHATRRVLAAPKDHVGNLSDPEALGLTPRRLVTKKGPSGTDVEDPQALAPEGALLVLSDKPLRALVALASSGDARGYLLRLIAEDAPDRAPARPAEARAFSEWQYASVTYRRWAIAFGEPAILKIAERVRGARKLLESGNVAEPAAIGATRRQPYLAFQDIAIRSDTRGYVRAVLAFGQGLDSDADVSAAYQKLVSTYGEREVLSAGQKMATRTGNAMWAYANPVLDSEWRMLSGVMAGTVQVARPPDAASEPLVDNPQYLVWKGFAPGAKATYVSGSWRFYGAQRARVQDGGTSVRATYLLQSIDEREALVWLTETVSHGRQANRPREQEIKIPSKLPASWAARLAEKPAKETGEEALTVGGKAIRARWRTLAVDSRPGAAAVVTKEWVSDDVPGARVRTTQEGASSVYETNLEAFEGTRAEGAVARPAVTQPPAASTRSAGGAASSPDCAPTAPPSSAGRGKPRAGASSDPAGCLPGAQR
jgi:hypothetical protein